MSKPKVYKHPSLVLSEKVLKIVRHKFREQAPNNTEACVFCWANSREQGFLMKSFKDRDDRMITSVYGHSVWFAEGRSYGDVMVIVSQQDVLAAHPGDEAWKERVYCSNLEKAGQAIVNLLLFGRHGAKLNGAEVKSVRQLRRRKAS